MSSYLFAAGYGGSIYTLRFAPSALSVSSSVLAGSAPTWLEQHPTAPLLFAIDEFHPKDGRVSSFAIGATGELALKGATSSGGEGPAHLAFGPGGKDLYVANYGGGTVARIVLKEGGEFVDAEVAQKFQFFGHGPQSDRQESPHPHGVFIDPTGKLLFCADLGTDTLRLFGVDAAGELTQLPSLPLPAGSGPRHLIFSHKSASTQLYLLNELQNSLSIYGLTYVSPYEVSLTLQQTTSVLPPSQAPHGQGWTAAELAFMPSGSQILVSNRSPGPGLEGPMDKLVMFELDTEGLVSSGPTEIDVNGRGLRHFGFSPDGKFMAVACEKTNEVVMFEVAERQLKEVARVKDVSRPTVVRWKF